MTDSIGGGMFGMLSILGRNERAPDREFEVVLAPMGKFMTIDGRAFVGNTPVFHAKVGELVQWDVMALGSDFHTFHVHGHRWVDAGHRRRLARHADGRAGRVVPHPLARERTGHVALPLPRRGSHDEGHDRHLSGVASDPERLGIAGLVAALPAPGAGRRGRSSRRR